MRALTAVFRTLVYQQWILSIIGVFVVALSASLFSGIFSDQPKPENLQVLMVMIGLVLQMMFTITWGQYLGKLLRSRYNHLKPLFIPSIGFAIIAILFLFTVLPCLAILSMGFGSGIQILMVFTIAISCLTLTIINSTAGAIWLASTIVFLASEISRVRKNSGSEFFDYISFNSIVFLVFICVVFVSILFFYIRSIKPKVSLNSDVSKSSHEEVNIRLSSPSRLSLFFDRNWIQLRYSLRAKFGIIHNQLDTALMSGQYQMIFISRAFLVLVMLVSLVYSPINEFFIGFFDGFLDSTKKSDSKELLSLFQFLLIMLLAFFAAFDTSLFTRVYFAQRFLWLKLPVDGFESFKRVIIKKVLLNIAIEVSITFLVFFLIIRQSPFSGDYIWLFVAGFFAFKFLTICVSYAMIRSKISTLTHFLCAATYALFFAGLTLLTSTIERSDTYVLLAFNAVLLSIIIVFTRGFKRQSII
ncbi:hypothetical protein [Pleionea litopenaei]|uniref:Uncharacterized protein n=1 Tax=Pleionea litopenaei TaxID=3070815 RepID=A0AA51RR38_9GAMM|nr:hypothetical protein [Pleionea sp. HL-JVS1]WMS86055.1 hypothetical protein Q9312_12590 [Pleionea sp. HL-JVS1]